MQVHVEVPTIIKPTMTAIAAEGAHPTGTYHLEPTSELIANSVAVNFPPVTHNNPLHLIFNVIIIIVGIHKFFQIGIIWS